MMKTNKEYPATHSMSTSWYAVDLDGNVAIIEFEDNGPVPVFVPESSPEYIIFQRFVPGEGNMGGNCPYTAEEVDRMLEDARDAMPDEGGCYFLSEIVVRVDMTRYDEFMEIANLMVDEEDCNTYCLDRERGLFYLCWCGTSKDIDAKADAAVASGVMTPLKQIDLFQYGENSHLDVLCNYPFYVYRQDYNSLIPLRRTVTPEKPLTEDRLPPKAKETALRIPLHFKDAQSIQIAKYAPFDVYDTDGTFINRRPYAGFRQEDGSLVYVAQSSIISEACGRTCSKCCPHGKMGVLSYAFQRIKEPTILVVKDLQRVPYEIMTSSDDYLIHSVFVPVLSGIPCAYHIIDKEGGRSAKNLPVGKWFQECRTTLEENILFFQPHVVLVYREMMPFFGQYYPVQDGMIQVGGYAYPCFVWEEREQHVQELEKLARLPYRGGQIDWVIPMTAEDIQAYAKYHYLD